MSQILRDVYSDTAISSLLGFKGGTCAFFFYGLTRFSVDLDFDLLGTSEEAKKIVFENIGEILRKYGELKDSYIKHQTIFFLLSYGNDDHNIKIEINLRSFSPDPRKHYEMREYLGIAMLVGKKEYLFSSKLVALTDRRVMAMRDIYDIWFFAKNLWDLDPEIIKLRTGSSVKEYLAKCIKVIGVVKDNEILGGLAELLPDEKAKAWVKNSLRDEVVFLLKSFQSALT